MMTMHELQDSLGPTVDDAVGRPEPNSVFDAVKAGDYVGVLRQQAIVLARVLDAAGQTGRAAAAAMASKELRDLYEVLEGMEAGGGDGDEHEQSEADRARQYWERHGARLAVVGDAADPKPA